MSERVSVTDLRTAFDVMSRLMAETEARSGDAHAFRTARQHLAVLILERTPTR